MNLKIAKKVWLDGKLIDWQKAKISVFSHSLQRGSAIFESIAFYNTSQGPAIFRLDEHIDRLFESARLTEVTITEKKRALIEVILKLIKLSKFKEGGIRPVAFLKEPSFFLMPENKKAGMAIAIFKNKKSFLGPAKIKNASFKRYFSPITKAKIAANYALGRAAQIEAQKAGFNYTIFFDQNDNLAEGPTSSIFLAKKGALYTPPSAWILKGVTRDSVIRVVGDLGYQVSEKIIKKKELLGADEAFMAGTTAKIWPVVKIDAKIINYGQVGPITKKLQGVFDEIIHGRNKKYLKWLTFVS